MAKLQDISLKPFLLAGWVDHDKASRGEPGDTWIPGFLQLCKLGRAKHIRKPRERPRIKYVVSRVGKEGGNQRCIFKVTPVYGTTAFKHAGYSRSTITGGKPVHPHGGG